MPSNTSHWLSTTVSAKSSVYECAATNDAEPINNHWSLGIIFLLKNRSVTRNIAPMIRELTIKLRFNPFVPKYRLEGRWLSLACLLVPDYTSSPFPPGALTGLAKTQGTRTVLAWPGVLAEPLG